MASKKDTAFDALGRTYHPGEPLPAPEAVVKDTNSAWALFQAIQDGTHDDFAQTQRGAPPPGTRKKAPRGLKPITVEEVLFEVRRNNRVCPMPSHWQKMHDTLRETNGAAAPPSPINVTSWRSTGDLDKRSCLRKQIEWAADKNCLEAFFTLLKALPEEKWHHMGG